MTNLNWDDPDTIACLEIMQVIKKGYPADPGTSDLDNEQPIHVQMTLGDYRKACSMIYRLRPGY